MLLDLSITAFCLLALAWRAKVMISAFRQLRNLNKPNSGQDMHKRQHVICRDKLTVIHAVGREERKL